jgi:hypothetical protein
MCFILYLLVLVRLGHQLASTMPAIGANQYVHSRVTRIHILERRDTAVITYNIVRHNYTSSLSQTKMNITMLTAIGTMNIAPMRQNIPVITIPPFS